MSHQRLIQQTSAWSYDNVEGPKYDAVPRMPRKTRRVEERFVPDVSVPGEKEYIEISALYKGDVELERKVLREVSKKRGEHLGRAGYWVETEFEVIALPERKTLFTFGGEGRATR